MQPIFSRNKDHRKIAFLNWRVSNDESDITKLKNMADGFIIGAIELAKRCWMDNDDKKADILIFPVLHNINHGIELYLKGIMWTLNELLSLEAKIEGRHNIDQMFRMIKSKIRRYVGQKELKDFEKITFELESYISELTTKINATSKDDKMDFSRYPFNNRYENHFYVDAIGTVEVDLENFISRFESIHGVLIEISDWLYEKLDDSDEDDDLTDYHSP